jgi:hypothetical protein
MWTAAAAGREPGPPVIGTGGEVQYDAEWQEAPRLPPEELYQLWYGTIARCREEWTALIADGGLDVHCTNDPGYVVNRRRWLVDILEENLLHNRPDLHHPRGNRRTHWQRPALIGIYALNHHRASCCVRRRSAAGQARKRLVERSI